MLQNLFQRWKTRQALTEFKALREFQEGPPKSAQSGEVAKQDLTPQKKLNYLLAFVDPKDPFMVGPVAGEELTGPILSIMSTREFDSLYLFHTPHTRPNAVATSEEILRRYPQCRVTTTMELNIADPKSYSVLLSLLTERVRKEKLHLELQKPQVQGYICVSSGTAEMRGAWFLLTSLGVLSAKLLQVGTPAQPLFGGANVKEIAVQTSDWLNIRELAMPAEYRTPGTESSPRSLSRHAHKPASSAAEEAHTFSQQPEEFLSGFSVEIATAQRSALAISGLDDALQELSIHVGSASLRHAAERAGVAAESDLPVLLLGETGSGKERFAHLIHRMSARASRELVAVNCAAIPESLAEDHLFGHVKGAYTGATADKKGLFESADGSTLFLDEIAELTLEVQAKLLRVIQDGMVQRMGTTTPRKVDVRIIAATNRNPKNEVSAGRFREDLYFRLEVVQIELPALRDRRSDIPELAVVLLRKINQRRQRPRQLSAGALLRLERYDWPGNVRQLCNVLERSVLYAKGDSIEAEDLIITQEQSPKDNHLAVPELRRGFKLDEHLSRVRELLFDQALAACNGNQRCAADLLGVSKQAVSKFVASRATTKVDAQ